MDDRLVTYDDLLELILSNKMQRSDFDDIVEQMTAVLSQEYDEELNCCEDCDSPEAMDAMCSNASRKLLCAGYTDCMDEAIRFLVEEENISPEHPIVRNLKAHLERSKERILDTVSEVEFPLNELPSYSRLSHTETVECREFFHTQTQCIWDT